MLLKEHAATAIPGNRIIPLCLCCLAYIKIKSIYRAAFLKSYSCFIITVV